MAVAETVEGIQGEMAFPRDPCSPKSVTLTALAVTLYVTATRTQVNRGVEMCC